MILTALIMGITVDAGQPMTDAEVRAKALQLGMVDPDSLSLSNIGAASGGETPQPPSQGAEGSASASPSPAPTASPEGTDRSEAEGSASASPSPVPTASPEGTDRPEAEGSASVSPAPDAARIVIVRGDNSYTVSRRLQEAGLVEDAREFDAYLVDNGYSKSIRTGTYEIPLGATWEEIADIIA